MITYKLTGPKTTPEDEATTDYTTNPQHKNFSRT